MFTTVDKAITAAVMGVLSIATLVFHVSLPGWLSPENIAGVIAALSPFLVYLVPNKPS